MTTGQKKQFRQHRYPVKTFRGDSTRPAYTLYSLWDYPTYLAAANELDELIDQWPRNRPRTVALLAVRAAFFANGATHWAEQQVWEEDQMNVHALMLYERQRARRYDPVLSARHARDYALAEAALVESQRRKQGSPTGTPGPLPRQGRAKVIKLPRQPLGQAKSIVSLALHRVDELLQAARLSSRVN